MRIAFAVLALVLLVWVETGSAQDPVKTYSVTVSVHEGLSERLSENDVKEILDKASKLLQKKGHGETADNVKCNVAFTLKGPIRSFGSDDTPKVVDKPNLDAVHRVRPDPDDADFHVKVVDKIINFCRFQGAGFRGCAFPTNFRSIIVVHPKRHIGAGGQPIANFPDHILWAHEFGHLTGLGHRENKFALMTSCPLQNLSDDQVQVTPDECMCLRHGPGFGPNGTCPLPGPTRCSP